MLYPGLSCISSLCLTPVIIDKVLKSNGSLKITVDVNFSLLIGGNLNPNLRGLAIIFDRVTQRIGKRMQKYKSD